MASGPQSFYSTPTFELFRRGLQSNAVKVFRGINAYQSVAGLTPDWALDCLNVMAPGWGGLSKFRLPVIMDGGGLGPNGPDSFFDFQKGDGTRQVVAAVGNSLYYMDWANDTTLGVAQLIHTAASDAGPWSMVEANNILYMANGIEMKRWTGVPGQFWNWGIVAPVAAPTIGSPATPIASISRAANVVTFQFDNTGPPYGATYLQVGDLVTINNPADLGFNGTFAITGIVTPGLKYTYAQVAAAAGPYNNVASATFLTSSAIVPNVTCSRVNGIATYTFTPQLNVSAVAMVGTHVDISGYADATFNGNFEVLTATGPGASGFVDTITVEQAGQPDSAGAANGTLKTGVTITGERTYALSQENNITSDFSNIGPTIHISGPLTNRIVYVSGPAFTDPQVTNYQLFATIDNGGDLFEDDSGNASGSVTVLADFIGDGDLNLTVQGPLLNNPPPVGKYLAKGQSRIFIANLVGAPNQIAYTGYEQILIGRPENTVPPNNRILLQIGSEQIAGIGVIRQGVVGFSHTKRMYMMRGQLEDISVTIPVAFSSFLEELPWDDGTMSHQSIQATAYGLLYWSTDRTVKIFDGRNKPQDISQPIYPILRRATAGSEVKAASCYFNWLERDWYGLTVPIDGGLNNGISIFWSLQAGADGNNSIDIFPSSIQCDFMQTLSTPAGQKVLAISQNGRIMNLPVSQDTTGGIGDPAIIPATANKLGAFWRGAYWGNESPYRSKMFRYGQVITDQDGFSVVERVVDDRDWTLNNPKIIGPIDVFKSSFAINWRGKRCSIEIVFPQDDVSANVLEYYVASVATSDRR